MVLIKLTGPSVALAPALHQQKPKLAFEALIVAFGEEKQPSYQVDLCTYCQLEVSYGVR